MSTTKHCTLILASTLHTDLSIPYINEEISTVAKESRDRTLNHHNPPITNLYNRPLGNQRLWRYWPEDLTEWTLEYISAWSPTQDTCQPSQTIYLILCNLLGVDCKLTIKKLSPRILSDTFAILIRIQRGFITNEPPSSRKLSVNTVEF